MIGSSMLMASFGFMVHSVSPAMSDDNNQKLNVNSNYRLVPTNADGSINVKLSDVQLDRIIPKNEDGSLNVMLSDKQVKMMATPATQSINIQEIGGIETFWKTGNGGRWLQVSCIDCR
jgi:hypothetical protein